MESLKGKETSQRPFDPRQNIAFCHRPRRKRVQDEAPGAEIQFGTTRADSARSELSRPDNIMMAGMTHSTPSEQALMAAWRRSPCGRHDPQNTAKYGAYIPDRAGEVASPQPEHREVTHSCPDHLNAIIGCYDRKPSHFARDLAQTCREAPSGRESTNPAASIRLHVGSESDYP